MLTDFRAHVMRRLYYIRNVVICFCSTLWCRAKMRLWGIRCGKKSSFRGNMLFFRGPGSSIRIGDRCSFNSNTFFNFRGINHPCILQAEGGKITIGDDCGFSGVSIVSSVEVTIGNNVMCGANVIIGDRNDHEDKYPKWEPAPVRIGNNVWIGMNCIVMRGVTIGDNVVIGAGSVVTKNIPAGVTAAGCPCKVI